MNSRDALTGEFNRTDRAILSLQSATEDIVEVPTHLQEVRSDAAYPADSFEGRQQYLDALSDQMFQTQVSWHSVLVRYEASSLSIEGTEGADYSFRYKEGTLLIDLTDVKDLPDFEQRPVAVFYGYPGLQAFVGSNTNSLRQFVDLPGYQLGWASYILDYIASRDAEHLASYVYFSRLIASLALTDLYLHTGRWQQTQALEYLVTNTPYHPHRLALMLNEVQSRPGYYAAGVAGKTALVGLFENCRSRELACEAAFHQQIVSLGPIPFSLLAERLTLSQ